MSKREEIQATLDLLASNRLEKSLGLLATRFVHLLQHAPGGIVNLKMAAECLEVKQKRRIYDITNVLEGIGLIEKKNKNIIQWKGPGEELSRPDSWDKENSAITNAPSPSSPSPDCLASLKADLVEVRQLEEILDLKIQQVKECNAEVLSSSAAYLRLEELAASFPPQERLVLLIQSPSEDDMRLLNNCGRPPDCRSIPQPVPQLSIPVDPESTAATRLELSLHSLPPNAFRVFLLSFSSEREAASIKVESGCDSRGMPPVGQLNAGRRRLEAPPSLADASSSPNGLLPKRIKTIPPVTHKGSGEESCGYRLVEVTAPPSTADYLYSLRREEGLMELFDLVEAAEEVTAADL